MKTIGFIDYYLDEWHAEHYPKWIEQASGGTMKVAYAYGMADSPSGRTNVQWSEDKGIELLPSIAEVVDRSDYIIVLSPDHPQYHEPLAQLPLQSGKPTYIDKTFAPDRQTARRLFNLAEQHGTPLFSSSALRFAAEYAGAERAGIENIISFGPGRYDNYSIHQIEPIVSLLGPGVRRMMYTGTPNAPSWLIGFSGGRQAEIHHLGGGCPFSLTVSYTSGETNMLKADSDYFGLFSGALVRFFETCVPPVDPAETVAIITIIEQGFKAKETPYQWVELPSE